MAARTDDFERSDAGPTLPIAVTWASTSADPAKRQRIGKIWAPEGKWPVTDGVERNAFVFELTKYLDLEAFAADLTARLRVGCFASVAGRLKLLARTIDRNAAYSRDGRNFSDLASRLLALDFDGLAPMNAGARLDRPQDFDDAVLIEIRRRLPATFKNVDCLLVATASTGLPVNSKGEPANGCARFRALFLLSRPLFSAEQKQLTLALKQLPGLDCLDPAITAVPQFSFIARPEFPDGMTDPIQAPVLLFKDDQRQVDVDTLEMQVGVTLTPRERVRPSAEERLLNVDPAVRYELIEQLVRTIPNDTEEHGGDWIAVMHGIKGASGDPHWGKHLWLEFCARWTKGDADKDEDERVWESARFDHGNAGIGTLLRLAWRAATPEAIAAVAAVRQAQARASFDDQFDDSPDEPTVDSDNDENDDHENADDPPVDLWKAIDTPDLPVGLLPARVEKFVRANAKALGADSAGLAGASLAALAAAIPDRVKLQVQAKGKKWLSAARIWIALVGDPSTKKTPIMDTALVALRAKDVERRREYAALKAMWDALSKKEKAEALAAGRGQPEHNRLIISDTTSEAAGEILMTSPNGVLGVYDELSGWFGQMERYGQSGQGLSERSFWLQARNGGSHSIDRIIRGTNHIPNLSITLVGGIQPEPMRKVAGNSSDDGLIQRLSPIMLRPAELTDDEVDTEEVDKDFTDLIETLLDLAPTVRPLKFDEGAQTIRRELEIEHHERTRSWEPINKKMSSAFGKQDGYFAELCVIWHCAENAGQDPLPAVVTEDTTRRAAEFMRTFLRSHLIAFYAGLLDLSDEHDRLKAIAGYILTHKPKRMNSREVQKAVRSMRKLGAREVTLVMEHLEAFGWLFRHPPPRHGALPVWKINPAVHVQFAEQAKEEAARRTRDRATIIKDATARGVGR